MAKPIPDGPWPDPAFLENYGKFPVEELWKHENQHVAWSMDGTKILCAADTREELERKLVESGIDPQRVVHDYVEIPT